MKTDEIANKAKRAPGRPVEMKDGKRVNVYLDAATLEEAQKLGDGNVSDGLRRAVLIAKQTGETPCA